ncbi:MAG: hypothetical protein NTZ10_05170 [Candidatus Saganbacteria bacterium]|nr:hypothetical protein [Candidatus Saganbacteria bacterium]
MNTSDRSGLTLIEILTASFIFILFLSCFLVLFKSLSRGFLHISCDDRKILSAAGILESMEAAAFDDIRSSPDIEVSDISSDLKTMRVRLGRIELFTLRSKY